MLGRLLYKARVEKYRLSKQVKSHLRLGRLPDFLIVGTQKGGTTTLFELLRWHPDVKLPFIKEKHFFNEHFGLGEAWYKASFPLGSSKLTGESTPHYLFHEKSPERAKSLLPQAKIIILLREPVERAFSHYHHNLRVKGRETLTFAEAIQQEKKRTALSAFNLKHYSYTQRGIYLPQIKRWLSYFGDEQVLILDSKTFFEQTEAVWTQVLEFLALKNHPLPQRGIFNKSTSPSQIDKRLEEQLRTFFEPHTKDLNEFLQNRG